MTKANPQKVLDAKLVDRITNNLARKYGVDPKAADADYWRDEAEDLYAQIRAAVYAITPGRQRAANIRELLNTAVSAACRVIRRRG